MPPNSPTPPTPPAPPPPLTGPGPRDRSDPGDRSPYAPAPIPARAPVPRAGGKPGPGALLASAGIGSGQGWVGPAGSEPKRARVLREMREHIAHSRNSDAVRVFEGLNKLLRSDPEVQYVAACAMENTRQFNRAIQQAKQSLEKTGHVAPMLVMARCYRAMGETEKVLAWCDRAAAKAPAEEVVSYVRGGALEEAGQFDEATEVLRPLVEKHQQAGRSLPMALRIEWPKLLVQAKRFDEAIALIDETVAMPAAHEGMKSMLLYLKAKAADRKKDYDAAFAAADIANGIGRVEFDPRVYEEQVSALTDNWSREAMADFPISACGSELPVFVAGMPRSGTSLIDQIIDAHPKGSGVGELNTIERFAGKLAQAWDPEREPGKQFGGMDGRKWTRAAEAYVKEIRSLAPPGTERVVNKALGNNKLVGLIARLFPRTRIIHAVRDPRDVAISCFMGGFNNRLHPWTTRLEWASHAWAQSQRMMDHWKATLDVEILEVNYERLVADPENEFPRIIAFLGLEWDEKCFDFHKSRRTVRTLSYDQVNRPLYTSSSGRHTNYTRHIEGVEFPRYDPWERGG
ncbi:MAG: sulfotransferase family protein [Phycisphaeraceae bacterium]|nr:MAG: sulfotransferase family protein [Phycisphaeraceae bacterium]